MHHTFMCVYMHACAHACMHGCILCVHTNVDVSINHLQVYEFMYPFKSVICRSCICVQFILIHSICFVLSLTLNMLVTLRSLVIDAIKNILNLNLNLNTLYDSIKGHMNLAKQLVMGIGMRSMAGSEMFKHISQVRPDHLIFSTAMHHSRNWKLF